MKNHIKILRSLVGFILLLNLGTVAHAADITAPVILVATERMMGSPNQETVLLAVPAGDGQHMGLIVNLPTSIDLATVFPEVAMSQRVADPVFFGGPEMSGALFAAIRAANPPSDHSVPLMPGLFLVTDQDTVGRLIKTTSNTARYFTGFVVWGPSELDDEIRSGMWDIQSADASVLFRANPKQLWFDLARNKRHVAAR